MILAINKRQTKILFELLKQGNEISMKTVKDIKGKENYIIFYYKTDENGKKIYEEETKKGEIL